jgi:hypothetical protein
MQRLPERLAVNATSGIDVECQEQTLWQTYSRLVERYLFVFEFMDDAISRLLFFSPLSSSEKGVSRWREVVYGFLQLHRLAIDIALRQRRCLSIETNHYGTTIAVQEDRIPAIGVRIALTVLQSLGPILQELTCATTRNEVTIARRQCQTRAVVERLRFLLRGYLLFYYWRNIWNENCVLENSGSGDKRLINAISTPGLLMEGGLFPTHAIAPNLLQERARIEREQYVGRRSGKRLSGRHKQQRQLTVPEAHLHSAKSSDAARVLIGELLYIIRPLYQTESALLSDGTRASLLKSWLLCLGIDLSSLWSLRSSAARGNSATRYEWKRRRLRLLLYLLRVPAWDRITQPTVDRVTQVVEKVPLFGRLCSNYLWEWLYYWRLYRAEEG